MAAAPISSAWIPEDDLLLKNAVEAGASLEALAKGAVQFSRRFTFLELRDRWHSLLYDPDISAQASTRMVELENSGSIPSSKFYRSDNYKGREEVHQKRKIGSIRRQYYGMRKKIRSDLLNSTDIGFPAESDLHDCGALGGDFQVHVQLGNAPRDGNCMLGDCSSDHFGLQEADFEMLHRAFPETMGDIATTAAVDDTGNAFHSGCQNPVKGARKNSLYRFPEDVSTMIRSDGRGSFEPTIEHKDAHHMLKDNSINLEKHTSVEGICSSQALPNGKLFVTDDSETKPLTTSDPMNDNRQNLCSGFGERQHFNSSDSDGSASFHMMGFSSPLPRPPLWKTMEDISAPSMPVNVNSGDGNQGAEETSTLPDDGDRNRKNPLGYDDVRSGHLSRDGHSAVFVNTTAVSEGEFADLSDSLLNFSNEDELLFMDVDVKDTMDKSNENLNSPLLSSPTDVQDGDLRNFEPKTSAVSNACLATPSEPCPAESEDIASFVRGDPPSVYHSEVIVPSTSVLNPDARELTVRNTYCTLNTEDPEIPCNDDIFLLIHHTSFASSARQPITVDSIEPLSSSAEEKDNEQGLNLIKKEKDPTPSFTWSQMVGPSMLPESVPGRPHVGVKSELPDTKCLALLPGEVKKALRDQSQCRSTHAAPITTTVGVLAEDVSKALDTPATVREMPSHAEAGSVKMTLRESMVNPSTSDEDESESDNDVPYFSDIEAMILEMDLGPYDQDSYISKQVLRYQYEDSKRTIIRLEQCANSSLERAMTSQGALAILYGRHLKYYIRKTEVILGRSTDDIDVDIDLRKEGRANKISRRQAIIKMERDGSFFLKNLGKSSLSVNGKAVATGMLLTLSSSCLIEIKGISFVFEINHKYVRRYLDNITKKIQGKNSNFEWSPAEEP